MTSSIYTQWFGFKDGQMVKEFPAVNAYTKEEWAALLRLYDGKQSEYGDYIYLGVEVEDAAGV